MENSYYDDFFTLLKTASNYNDKSVGGRFYDPDYGGWLSSDNKRQMYSNNFTNYMNYMTAMQTNQANLDLAKQQNEWNVEQWNRENKYNEPIEQVQRLRAAGLSAAAAAQAVSPNQAQPLQSANLANQQVGNPMTQASFSAGSPFIQMLSGLQDIIGLARNFTNLKRDKVALKSEENELDYQIPYLGSRNAQAEWANKLQIQSFEQSAKMFPYSRQYAKWQAKNEKVRNQALKLANQAADWQNKLLQQKFDFTEKWNEKEIERIGQEIKNLEKVGVNLDKTGKQIDAATNELHTRSDLNVANKEYTEEATKGQREENKITENEARISKLREILVRHGSPQTEAGQMAAFMAEKQLSDEECIEFIKSLRKHQEYGHTFLYDNQDEYIQEFYENVWNQGMSQQGNYGLYQVGGYRPVVRQVKKFFGY